MHFKGYGSRRTLVQPKGNHLETSQSNADAKKSSKYGPKKKRGGIHLPKMITDIIYGAACGRRIRMDDHHEEMCHKPTANMEQLLQQLQQLQIAASKPHLKTSETKVANVDAGEVQKAVDVEYLKKPSLPRFLSKSSSFGMMKKWKTKSAGYYRALPWNNTIRARDVTIRQRETKDDQEGKHVLELWKKRIGMKGGVQEDNGEKELCKKRILMGGRCRTLNLSGRLNYDENGVFVPEEITDSPCVFSRVAR